MMHLVKIFIAAASCRRARANDHKEEEKKNERRRSRKKIFARTIHKSIGKITNRQHCIHSDTGTRYMHSVKSHTYLEFKTAKQKNNNNDGNGNGDDDMDDTYNENSNFRTLNAIKSYHLRIHSAQLITSIIYVYVLNHDFDAADTKA